MFDGHLVMSTSGRTKLMKLAFFTRAIPSPLIWTIKDEASTIDVHEDESITSIVIRDGFW